MPTPKVIEPTEDFPLKPSDIDASKYMWDAFGNHETDVSAGYIVRFMQERGDSWIPFTYGEINAFYQKTCAAAHPGTFGFNHLIGPFTVTRGPWNRFSEELNVVVREGGESDASWRRREDTDVFRVTDEFVRRCHRSSPRTRTTPATV